jgi:hypothetical protein
MSRFSVSILQSVNSLTVQEEHSQISMIISRENVFRGNGVRAENIEVRGLELFWAGIWEQWGRYRRLHFGSIQTR